MFLNPTRGFVAVAGGALLYSLGLKELTSIEHLEHVGIDPTTLGINSIYPNPFESHATLQFTSPGLASVTLEIFDLSGRRVHQQEVTAVSPGQQTLIWNGTGLRGEPMPGGVYLVRLASGSEFATARVVLVR